MTKVWFGILAILAVVALAYGIGYNDAQDADNNPRKPLPACQYEDSQHCYWDASEQGNGRGHDVVNP